MTIWKLGCALTLVLVTASCSSNKAARVWLGPDVTEEEALAAIEELEAAVEEAFLQTEGPTGFADLPSGKATYSGIIYGEEGGGDGPLINHAADLKLVANFDAETVDGSITNFITSLAGFDHPNGTVAVSGTIFDDLGDAALEFSGTGDLVQGDVSAEYDLLGADGYFGGTNAQAMAGTQSTDFNWLTGPDAGTTSFSDGGFGAIKK